MRYRGTYSIALALFGLACGPPKVTGDADVDADADAESQSGDEPSSSSASSETPSTATNDAETSDAETSGADTLSTFGFVPMGEFTGGEYSPCEPFAGDCPNGEKCVPYSSTALGSWDANKCVPVLGERAPGEPCTYSGPIDSTDDCDATSFCWDVQDVDGEAVGTCAAFCTGTSDDPECPEDSQCLDWDCDCIYLCSQTCDPLLQDCAEGLACFWATDAFFCTVTTTDTLPGEPCGYINDCAGGNGCMPGELIPNCMGSACCSPWCELGTGDLPCEVVPGSTCVPFFEQGRAPLGYENVGVCLLPP